MSTFQQPIADVAAPLTTTNSSPSDIGRTGQRWLYLLALFLILWRFVCFLWLPLNLQGWPGALCETSAFAGTSLVVIWTVLGDGTNWHRVVQAGAIVVLLRLAMFVGIACHGLFTSRINDAEANIFRLVEDETLVESLLLSLLVRWFTNLRLSAVVQHELASLPPRHVSLRQLFTLTAVIAGVLGARQAAPLIWGEGLDGAIRAIISAHVVAIVLTSFLVLMLLGNVSRWTFVFLTVTLISLPLAICGYFLNGGDLRMEDCVHFCTAVLGPVVTSSLAVLACRAAGIRVREVCPQPRRELPHSLPADLISQLERHAHHSTSQPVACRQGGSSGSFN